MAELELPRQEALTSAFLDLSRKVEPIRRCVSALRTGRFEHPDGRIDDLGPTRISIEQAALISCLCRQCCRPLSVEVGFGMGSSATVILGTRSFLNQGFEHLIFDPYSVMEGTGDVVQSYLVTEFGDRFRRINKPSEIHTYALSSAEIMS